MDAKEYCWQFFSCNKDRCPAHGVGESACWLITGTLCHDENQGEFLDKLEACLECSFFDATMDKPRLDATLRRFKKQLIEYRRMVDERDRKLEANNTELALGLSEVFGALREIAAGNPYVELPEGSSLELITKLKQMVNLTAVNLGEIVDLSHEFAMGLAEHFDVLHRVSSGDLTARVHGCSSLELLDSLKRMTNRTISGIAEEMATRKRVEAALKESEAKYRMIVDQIPGVVFRGYPDWSVDFFDDKIEQLTGYRPGEFNARRLKWSDIVAREDLEPLNRTFLHALKSERSYIWEYRILTKWQTTIWVQVRARIVCDEEGTIQYVSGVIYDITERKKADRALEMEKERLAVTLRSIGDGVVATDLNGRILLMNHVAERLSGWSAAEATGRSVAEVFHFFDEPGRSEPIDPVAAVMGNGSTMELSANTSLVTRDKNHRFISASCAPIIDQRQKIIGVVLVVRDVTEARKMEAELTRMDKLSSLGTLAGGIAHDFNNILTAILGNISLSMLRVHSDAFLEQRLLDAQKACLRAQQLSAQLLTFAKGGAPIKKAASLPALIRESTNLATCGSRSTCRLSLARDLWPVEIDEGQISQVIHNLVINADQAMPAGGIIEIVAKNVSLQDDTRAPLQQGRYVQLSIIDQGVGIHPDHLQNVFMPYFTTKSSGNGLGLATAYSIIRNHEGLITVESELDKGSSFSIYLPAAKAQVIDEATADEQPISGHGRVLIMDDEEAIGELVTAMLERLGYESTYVRSGIEAMERYKQAKAERRPYTVALFDLTIPGGMGGKEALEQLLAIDPAIKVIVSSGYSDDPVMADPRRYGFRGVLKKPYRIAELGRILDQVLQTETDS